MSCTRSTSAAASRSGSPRPAKAYLDDWAAPEAGWLRKYYPEGTDEPHVDVTPAVEKALQWVGSLKEREFVGTESRLNTIFDLLRQIVFGTETDPEQRIAELRRQRQQLDDQIARVECRRARPARRQRGPRPLPAVLRYRAGAARRLPRGGGELQEAGPAAAREDHRLARR